MTKADELLRRSLRVGDAMQLVIVLPNGDSAWMGCYEPDSIAAIVLRSLRAYLNEKPHEPTVRESHERILSGKGTPADLVNILGDPTQSVSLGVASPPHAAAEPEKPVAWLYRRHEGDENPIATVKRWEVHPYLETPLYAAVQQPIAREPPHDDSQLASDVAYLRAKNDPRLFDIANQLIYCWAQDGLLSKAQAERDKLRDELAETKRPLDDQMRRLNDRVVELNDENLALKRAALKSAEGEK